MQNATRTVCMLSGVRPAGTAAQSANCFIREISFIRMSRRCAASYAIQWQLMSWRTCFVSSRLSGLMSLTNCELFRRSTAMRL